jgi:hypothetical protein
LSSLRVGHVRSRAAILRYLPANDGSRCMGDVLFSTSSSNLIAFLMEVALCDHFLETHPKLKTEEIQYNLWMSQGLLSGCNKLKHVLSMLLEGIVAVENVGRDDANVEITCKHFKRLCKASVVD